MEEIIKIGEREILYVENQQYRPKAPRSFYYRARVNEDLLIIEEEKEV